MKNEEIKEILKLVADSDTKKDALLEEVKVNAKEQREKLERETQFLGKEREQIESFKKEARDEGLKLKSRVEELEYINKE